MKCHDTSCNNYFYHLCHNGHDSSEYNNEFDIIHNLKKRCRTCVDKLMGKFVKSVDKVKDHHNILLTKPIVRDEDLNNNKPVEVNNICEDNDEAIEINNNEGTYEIIGDVAEDVFDTKNDKVVQEVVNINKYGVKGNVNDEDDKGDSINILKEKILQDKMTDHYLKHYHKKGTPFIRLH